MTRSGVPPKAKVTWQTAPQVPFGQSLFSGNAAGLGGQAFINTQGLILPQGLLNQLPNRPGFLSGDFFDGPAEIGWQGKGDGIGGTHGGTRKFERWMTRLL